MWYIIDGYNVIKQYTDITNRNLVNGKLSFLSLLDRKISVGRITVVFDGFPKLGTRVYEFGIDVKFSREITADDYIKKLIKNKNEKNRITLVTDDRDLMNFSSSNNVQIERVKQFLKKWWDNKKTKKENNFTKPTNLSSKGRSITRYLYKKLGRRDEKRKD